MTATHQLPDIITSVGALLTPVAAVIAAAFAYRAKILSDETKQLAHSNNLEIQTGNGSTLGQAVSNIERDMSEISTRVYKNAEQIAKVRTEAQEHLYRYRHERSLVEE